MVLVCYLCDSVRMCDGSGISVQSERKSGTCAGDPGSGMCGKTLSDEIMGSLSGGFLPCAGSPRSCGWHHVLGQLQAAITCRDGAGISGVCGGWYPGTSESDGDPVAVYPDPEKIQEYHQAI